MPRNPNCVPFAFAGLHGILAAWVYGGGMAAQQSSRTRRRGPARVACEAGDTAAAPHVVPTGPTARQPEIHSHDAARGGLAANGTEVLADIAQY